MRKYLKLLISGKGSGFIWLDNLNCAGSESTPFHCPHNGFGVHNCRHYEDAGVQCTCKSSKMNSIYCMKFKSTSVSVSQVLKCQVVWELVLGKAMHAYSL